MTKPSVTKPFERPDVFDGQVTKQFERPYVSNERMARAVRTGRRFNERVTKPFERVYISNERVTKSFKRADGLNERVIKPFERLTNGLQTESNKINKLETKLELEDVSVVFRWKATAPNIHSSMLTFIFNFFYLFFFQMQT